MNITRIPPTACTTSPKSSSSTDDTLPATPGQGTSPPSSVRDRFHADRLHCLCFFQSARVNKLERLLLPRLVPHPGLEREHDPRRPRGDERHQQRQGLCHHGLDRSPASSPSCPRTLSIPLFILSFVSPCSVPSHPASKANVPRFLSSALQTSPPPYMTVHFSLCSPARADPEKKPHASMRERDKKQNRKKEEKKKDERGGYR